MQRNNSSSNVINSALTPSNMNNSDGARKEKSAIIIQKQVRMFLAKKKYGIQHLQKSQLTLYRTFVVGNDPVMPESLDNHREPDKKIALIATSGMRAVSLACQLGNPKNTPKLIIVDISEKVYEFWYAMREFTKEVEKAATAELFLSNLPLFLEEHKDLYRDLPDDSYDHTGSQAAKYPNQNIINYFNTLFSEYGFDYVRAVILHASLIKQTWEDANVFVKIRNILRYQGIDKIYMYPSNIASCIGERENRLQMLKNIADTQPVLSIHTDHCDVHDLPENVFLVTNNNPADVAKIIFTPNECEISSAGYMYTSRRF